jgi:hypothetical protein
VDDEAEVGLVEAHAERARRDQRLDGALPQRLLGDLALGGVRAAGVRDDGVAGRGEELAGVPCGGVARRSRMRR